MKKIFVCAALAIVVFYAGDAFAWNQPELPPMENFSLARMWTMKCGVVEWFRYSKDLGSEEDRNEVVWGLFFVNRSLPLKPVIVVKEAYSNGNQESFEAWADTDKAAVFDEYFENEPALNSKYLTPCDVLKK